MMEILESKRALKVLIVDDEPGVRRVLARQLSGLGHEIHEAADGIQGLAMLRLKKPEIVMLDLRMPKMDGHAFLKEMAAENSPAAVIVLSGNANLTDRVEVLLAGAVQFVHKPWSQADLVGALDRARGRLPKRAGQ